MNKPAILLFVGTRPNYTKAAPLIEELNKYFTCIVIDSGQHSMHKELGEKFRESLGIEIDYNLGIKEFNEELFQDFLFKLLHEVSFYKNSFPIFSVVFGDCNTTLYAAKASYKCNIPVAHVEAGLRSFIKGQREEYNRIVVDALSRYRFCTEESGIKNLRNESLSGILIGNTMIDSLMNYCDNVDFVRKETKAFLLLTLHRPENVDDNGKLFSILNNVSRIADTRKVLFPIHPRTMNNWNNKLGIRLNNIFPLIKILKPMNYKDFINSIIFSDLVITDSGGVQEECASLKVKCITVMEATERPSTVECGSNFICNDLSKINYDNYEYNEFIDKPISNIRFWDGKSSQRIAEYMRKEFNV